jgi:hypothetical protein
MNFLLGYMNCLKNKEEVRSANKANAADAKNVAD